MSEKKSDDDKPTTFRDDPPKPSEEPAKKAGDKDPGPVPDPKERRVRV